MRLDEKFLKKVMTGRGLKAIAQYAICSSGFYHREEKAEQQVICASEFHNREKA
jgi:hypothetical protein